ncbi:hypothetical protein M407DRAFT_247181 [Tulasnella calospora MUT 4182]|uniref:Uncharacterized protein n=1 Tax=Tulasnella calospora MUT 4182 TaxID=1051891 RepID=A0A0C3Q024_9AGAM|nr:hypothetical protein M407DRAFT_247181 [Tulasnella calospora MUT 4182]
MSERGGPTIIRSQLTTHQFRFRVLWEQQKSNSDFPSQRNLNTSDSSLISTKTKPFAFGMLNVASTPL